MHHQSYHYLRLLHLRLYLHCTTSINIYQMQNQLQIHHSLVSSRFRFSVWASAHILLLQIFELQSMYVYTECICSVIIFVALRRQATASAD